MGLGVTGQAARAPSRWCRPPLICKMPRSELLTHFVAVRKTAKKKPPPPRLTIRSLSLAEEDAARLERLAQDASDYIGWTVSSSAIVRVLIRHADRQGVGWLKEHLAPLIEREIREGTVWGRKKVS
jgi:hypothetical protein